MVIFFSAVLKHLLAQGRNYPFPKPPQCPRCRSCRLWGHGFVHAYFDGFHQPVILKRYRCPDCRCILRTRPKGYFPRFQAPIHLIRASINTMDQTGKWLPTVCRCRQNHWVRSLKRRIIAFFGKRSMPGLPATFDLFLQKQMIPVSRAI